MFRNKLVHLKKYWTPNESLPNYNILIYKSQTKNSTYIVVRKWFKLAVFLPNIHQASHLIVWQTALQRRPSLPLSGNLKFDTRNARAVPTSLVSRQSSFVNRCLVSNNSVSSTCRGIFSVGRKRDERTLGKECVQKLHINVQQLSQLPRERVAEWLWRRTRKPKVSERPRFESALDSLVAVRNSSPGRPEPCEGNLVAAIAAAGWW